MRRIVVVLLCVGLASPGCATRGSLRYQTAGPTTEIPAQNAQVLGEFAQRLGVGTQVRAVTAGNRTVRGTLVKTTDRAIFVQPRTRLAEPIVEIPLDQLLALDKETPSGGGVGKAIAIGAASGAGAALGVLLLLIAILGD